MAATDTGRVPDLLGVMLASKGTPLVDVGALTIRQALLEVAAGEVDGPAVSRLRDQHDDLAYEMGIQ